MKFAVLQNFIIATALTFSVNSVAQQTPYQQGHQAQYYQTPKPMTEVLLKQRLNAQLSFTKQQMAIDKRQADIYAANFARYQKQQATALKNLMDQAEKQREYTLKRLEMQQQLILNQLTQFQISQDTKN